MREILCVIGVCIGLALMIAGVICLETFVFGPIRFFKKSRCKTCHGTQRITSVNNPRQSYTCPDCHL